MIVVSCDDNLTDDLQFTTLALASYPSLLQKPNKWKKKSHLSQHANGGKSKFMHLSAPTNMAPMSEPPSIAQTTIMDCNCASDVIKQHLRNLQSKRDYLRRKNQCAQDQLKAQKLEMEHVKKQAQVDLDVIQDKLNDANDQIADLEHTNQQSLLLAQKHRDDAVGSKSIFNLQ